jgi:hypothetical protein
MIHGGQKYVLKGAMTRSATAILSMPERWQASFDGRGDVDLTGVRFLSERQVMWPAGSGGSAAAVWAAAKLVNAKTTKLAKDEFPDILRSNIAFKGPVYALPEKVLDVRSLVIRIAKNLEGRLFKGNLTEIRPGGETTVSGHVLRAQFLVFTAGVGNESALALLKGNGPRAQRRPLRQVMVRPLSSPLFGHGFVHSPAPRITVTSHPYAGGQFIWYLGGNVAEKGATMDELSALQFARKELQQIFPTIAWDDKEWATWYGDRAEPLDPKGRLPPGPSVEQHERMIVAWPTKLTFAPALSDRVRALLGQSNVRRTVQSDPPPLPTAEIGAYPWEIAVWRKIA